MWLACLETEVRSRSGEQLREGLNDRLGKLDLLGVCYLRLAMLQRGYDRDPWAVFGRELEPREVFQLAQ
jgi:hypothetical protein